MNVLKISVLCAAAALVMSSGAQAQKRVDAKNFACEQLLTGTPDAIEASIWISGYYNGVRKNTAMDMGQFKKNAEAVIAACRTNPKKSVMKTIDSMMSAGTIPAGKKK